MRVFRWHLSTIRSASPRITHPPLVKGWPVLTELASILGVRHFSDIDGSQLLVAGALLNLANGTAGRLLENHRSRALREAELLYDEIDAENTQIAHARPELSVTMACESRCLRGVMHTVLNEMTNQIA